MKSFLIEIKTDLWENLKGEANKRGISLRALIKLILYEWWVNQSGDNNKTRS